MKNKFKFSKDERELLRGSLDTFKNDAIKSSVDSVVGAGFSRSFSKSWGRVIIKELGS